MKSIGYPQAEKVMSKYLSILTTKDKEHLNVFDVRVFPSGENDGKAIVKVAIKEQEDENLDIFCSRNGIDYDIADCL